MASRRCGWALPELDRFAADSIDVVVVRATIARQSLLLRRVAFLSELGFKTSEIGRKLKMSPSAVSHAKARLRRIVDA